MLNGRESMILADTGYWVALANSKDQHHRKAVQVSLEVSEDPVTTWPVLTETCYLLQSRLGIQSVSRFMTSIEFGEIEVFDLEKKHLPRINQLMVKYSSLPMDLADASLVILAETLGHGRILSTDKRDFGVYRWKNHTPFQNLLLGDE